MSDFSFLSRWVLDLIRQEIAAFSVRVGFVGTTLDASHVGGVLGGTIGAPATMDHASLSHVTSDQHHAKSHVHLSDGSGTVAHSSLSSVTANQHHNQAHALVGADHTESSLTAGDVLTALTPTSVGFQTPGAGALVAPVERFTIDGALVALADVGGRFVVPAACSVSAVLLSCKDQGSAGTTLMDVNVNGKSLFVDAARPGLASSDADGYVSATPDPNTLAVGDHLDVDIDQVATAAGRADVLIEFAAALAHWPAPPTTDMSGDKLGPGDTDNQVLALGAGSTWEDGRISTPWVLVDAGTVYLFYTGSTVAGNDYQIGVASAPLEGFSGKGFTKYGSNPILGPGGGGTWDHYFVGGPAVIHDPSDGLWKMWYSGQDKSAGTGGIQKVGLATASSPFGPWTKSGSNPILAPSLTWEAAIASVAGVLRRGAADYLMFYTGDSVVVGSKIGLATSTDGVTWTKYASNPILSPSGSDWMGGAVAGFRTVILRNGIYYAYFVGKNTSFAFSKIGVATSIDLHAWTVNNTSGGPIMHATRTWEGTGSPPGETEVPSVVRIGGYDYLYYDCWFGIPSTIAVARLAVP